MRRCAVGWRATYKTGMKAMIFAAGLGTRLRPLTERMPKALVSVGGRALIDIQIEKLAAAGFDEIVVNVHHFADLVERHLEERYGNNDKIRLRISDERDELLDTGGGLRKAAGMLAGSEPFVAHNVDVLSNADLRALYEEGKGKAAVLLVSNRATQRYLLFDSNNRLVGWTNIATGEVRTPFAATDASKCRRLAFAGIQALSPKLLAYMERMPRKFSLIDFYLSVCAEVPVYGVVQPFFKMLDVGKAETLAAAEVFLRGGLEDVV